MGKILKIMIRVSEDENKKIETLKEFYGFKTKSEYIRQRILNQSQEKKIDRILTLLEGNLKRNKTGVVYET